MIRSHEVFFFIDRRIFFCSAVFLLIKYFVESALSESLFLWPACCHLETAKALKAIFLSWPGKYGPTQPLLSQKTHANIRIHFVKALTLEISSLLSRSNLLSHISHFISFCWKAKKSLLVAKVETFFFILRFRKLVSKEEKFVKL